MTFRNITFDEADKHLNWLDLTQALEQGHARPKAQVQDVVMTREPDTMLSRHAWIDGLGIAVKTAQVFPNNGAHNLPNINGILTLFDDTTGVLKATIDFHLVTKWKTVGDSLLAAQKLARPDSRNILVLGAGTVAANLIRAYSTLFPNARFQIWNRTASKAETLAATFKDHEVTAVTDLPHAVANADIVTSATMSKTPVLKGEWLRSGQHVDLIGAYIPSMREADDTAMQRSRIFVDSFDTTLAHIGELIDPLASGAIRRTDVLADYYDLSKGNFEREKDDEITLFKNGGGAHLDLMTANYILGALK
ncbi:MAG: ornithine cyclodeaminase/alanine dehydrogenase-like protein (mu-crystallin family) [Paracoccaceae bacterium]|jgi:ornithine cyclodeaminase/alanine dehydrogenase-like protein (mu-crystallin family)